MRGPRVTKALFLAALVMMSTMQVRADADDGDGDDDDDDDDDAKDFPEYDVDAGNDTDDANDTSTEDEAVYDENGIIMTSDHTFRHVSRGSGFKPCPLSCFV